MSTTINSWHWPCHVIYISNLIQKPEIQAWFLAILLVLFRLKLQILKNLKPNTELSYFSQLQSLSENQTNRKVSLDLTLNTLFFKVTPFLVIPWWVSWIWKVRTFWVVFSCVFVESCEVWGFVNNDGESRVRAETVHTDAFMGIPRSICDWTNWWILWFFFGRQ